MIFGDKTLVPYKNGLSSPKNVREGRNYPDFEYCIAPVHMKSKLVSAITNYSISSKKFTDGELKKDALKYFESRNYFESLFELEESTNNLIRVEIDMDSLSDDLYCLSNFDEEMLAVKPSSIHLLIKESNPENARENNVGYCYFDDEREKREYVLKKGSNSLEITLPVGRDVFSSIFKGIKDGGAIIYASIYLPAYEDSTNRMSLIIAPSTYIIDASYQGDNFVILQDITLSSSNTFNDSNEDNQTEIDCSEIEKEDAYSDTLEEISSKIGFLEQSSHETTTLLTSINSNIRVMSFLLMFLIVLFLFKFIW